MNQHGEFELSWIEDLLIIKMAGPFNDEGVLDCSEEVKALIQRKNLPSWRRLEILDDNTLASLSALEHTRELYAWYNEHGCRATAIVVSNSVQVGVIKEFIKCNDPIFYKLSEAIDWIRNR